MEIKNKIIFALFLFVGWTSFGQENLIHNAVVDQPTYNATPFYVSLVDDYSPKYYTYSGGWIEDDRGNQEGLSVWEGDMHLVTKVITAPAVEPEKIQFELHSPDWYMINKYDGYQKLRLTESGEPIMPHAGLGYIGMGPGELVQQQFFDANKFEEGETYRLQFYVRTYDDPTRDWSTGLDLNVYLRKSKMKYSLGANQFNNRCDPTKYFNKSSTSNTLQILNKPMDLVNYPTGQWYPVTIEFNAPSDSYDWIVIETEAAVLCDGPYVLLDDFRLSKSCEFPDCSRTSGEVFPNHNGLTSTTAPLKITNLDNAAAVTVEVFTMLGQPIWNYSVTCTNGIVDPIFWDGRTTSGSYAADASYLLKVTYTNDCGTESKTSAISKTGNHPPITNNIICNNSGVITPAPCCIYEPDLVIDNTLLPGIGLLDYRVISSINVAPVYTVTVTNNADVEMRAGNEILLNPGFTVEPGANYFAEIVPCTTQRTATLEPTWIQPTQINDDALLSQNSEDVLTLYPNPAKNTSTLIINDFKKGTDYEIAIYTMQGVKQYQQNTKVKKTTLNLSKLNAGMYFVKVSNGITTHSIKLIKQ
ncbi:T9SS type A sorting domain-containing protein [Kordia sp. TARA_039_SRF]|nr:T9SS type A sorting domain-containing protein [Kordia sp. TARA_039_SRF]